MAIENIFIKSSIARFESYKRLGDKTLAQLSEAQCFYRPMANVNSLAMIVQHSLGKRRSRWTKVLSEDGEKSWRNRDAEFEDFRGSKEALIQRWD